MTRYTLVRRAEREANDKLKVWLLGSDRPTLSTTTMSSNIPAITFRRLGRMSVSETKDLMSVMMFPLQLKWPESVK